MSKSEQTPIDPLELDHHLAQPANEGSLLSLACALNIKLKDFENIDNIFGKKCSEIRPLVQPLIDSVRDLYHQYYTADSAGATFDMINSVLFGKFTNTIRNISGVNKIDPSLYNVPSKKSHFHMNIKSIVDLLIKRLQFFDFVLANGWKSRFWEGQRLFHQGINKIVVTHIPPSIEQVVYRRPRDDDEGDEDDADNKPTFLYGSTIYEVMPAPKPVDLSNPQASGLVAQTIKINPIVSQVAAIVTAATILQQEEKVKNKGKEKSVPTKEKEQHDNSNNWHEVNSKSRGQQKHKGNKKSKR